MARTLTTGSPWRVILLFSVPLLIGNVVQQLYQVADAIVVGRWLGVGSLPDGEAGQRVVGVGDGGVHGSHTETLPPAAGVTTPAHQD